MIGCAIAVINSLDGIIPTLLDFMLVGSVILSLFPCQLTMITGSCKGRLLVLQLLLEPLREAERKSHPNAVWLFLN